MSEHTSPSPVIATLVRELRAVLPSTQSTKLTAHEEEIEKTSDRHDGRRALHCARWAIVMASDRDLPHPEWRRIKELHATWRDVVWGVRYAGLTTVGGRPAPLGDVEIEWIEDAAQVAKIVADAVGWDHVSWESLLQELIEMEPART